MNQLKTGSFIAELRKEKHMTQQQLAEKLNVSDKTVSKWENGKSMPDIAYLNDLSALLGVSIGEVLAGERFAETEYAVKTEETIVSLIKDKETEKRNSLRNTVIGFVLLALTVAGMLFAIPMTMSDGRAYPSCLFDLQGMAVFILITAALTVISGNRGKKSVLLFLSKTVVFTGLAVSLVGAAVVLSRQAPGWELAANLGIGILPVLYAVIVKIVVLLLLEKSGT